jgi:hypothetical protein
MKTNRWLSSAIALSVLAMAGGLILGGCASDKAPAEAAIAAAEQAVNAAAAEASKFVPDQVQSLQAALTSAKDKFAKGDYTAALADAKSLPDKAREVASAAAAKKAELTKTWESMSAGLPSVVDAIKSRVDILSQAKKLPANMTADTLAKAKSSLDEITQQWTAASDAFKGGNVADAISKATTVKAKAAEVLTMLGMPVPDALKS